MNYITNTRNKYTLAKRYKLQAEKIKKKKCGKRKKMESVHRNYRRPNNKMMMIIIIKQKQNSKSLCGK